MATYRVQSPSGEVYEIEAPDDATEAQVMERARQGAQVYAQNARTSEAINNRPDAQKTLALARDKALGPWASAAVRPIAKGVAALPLLAMDAGVAARNLMTGENYEHPSTMFNRALDSYTTTPEGIGKGAEFVSSALVGARAVPNPTAAAQAPAGFVKPAANMTQQVLREGRQAGYVAPPSTAVRPSVLARTLEGLSGKAATAQAASTRNQQVTNRLARRAVGLADDAPLTRTTLSAVRERAGQVYEQIARSGDIAADAQYIDDLAQLSRNSDEIAKDFPELGAAASHEIRKLTDGLLKDRFAARSGIELLKELRKQASSNTTGVAASDPAKRALGYAQREAASAVEDLIMRNLSSQGTPQLAQAFNQARTTIARAHDVEGALNESTGNVAARTLGTLAKKGKPLSGDLEMIARFSRAFPKATQEVNESFLGLSPLDYAVGGLSTMTGLAAGHGMSSVLPALALPTARVGARAALMSGPMQRGAAGLPGAGVPPSATRAIAATAPAISFGFEDSQLERQRRVAEMLRGQP